MNQVLLYLVCSCLPHTTAAKLTVLMYFMPLLQVYDYYNEKRQQAQSGCALELGTGEQQGAACQSLDSLSKLVYEVAYSGSAEQLRHVLEAENNAEKKHAAGEARGRVAC
jgi:hypothetical protein